MTRVVPRATPRVFEIALAWAQKVGCDPGVGDPPTAVPVRFSWHRLPGSQPADGLRGLQPASPDEPLGPGTYLLEAVGIVFDVPEGMTVVYSGIADLEHAVNEDGTLMGPTAHFSLTDVASDSILYIEPGRGQETRRSVRADRPRRRHGAPRRTCPLRPDHRLATRRGGGASVTPHSPCGTRTAASPSNRSVPHLNLRNSYC